MLNNGLCRFNRLLSSTSTKGGLEGLQNVFTRSLSDWQKKLLYIANGLGDGRPAPITGRPARVAITGGTGAIPYALLFRIAGGDMLGEQQVIFQLLESPGQKSKLEGVVMELQDCAFPLVAGIQTSPDAKKAFEGADFVILTEGTAAERGDSHKLAELYSSYGRALNNSANRDTVRVLVAGQPTNLCTLITHLSAPHIHRSRITGLGRLDHNRGLAMIANKLNVQPSDVTKFCVWGNRGSIYPDTSYTLVEGKKLSELLSQDWIDKEFIAAMQRRDPQLISLGRDSSASISSAVVQQLRDWVYGTDHDWTSMVIIPEHNFYGVEPGTPFSFPIVCAGGHYHVAPYIGVSKDSAAAIETSRRETVAEAVALNAKYTV